MVWADNRDDRDVVELGVVQTVEQVDGTWTGGGHADTGPARELRVADRLERTHLLVPRLDEPRTVASPGECTEQAVDPIAGIPEHLLHPPGTKPSKQVVRDSGHKGVLPSSWVPTTRRRWVSWASTRSNHRSCRRRSPRTSSRGLPTRNVLDAHGSAMHVLIFEGRDAAGKGATIKRSTEHLNHRYARGGRR